MGFLLLIRRRRALGVAGALRLWSLPCDGTVRDAKTGEFIGYLPRYGHYGMADSDAIRGGK